MALEIEIQALEAVDIAIREAIKEELDNSIDGNLAALIRARADLQGAITNLLCVRRDV